MRGNRTEDGTCVEAGENSCEKSVKNGGSEVGKIGTEENEEHVSIAGEHITGLKMGTWDIEEHGDEVSDLEEDDTSFG